MERHNGPFFEKVKRNRSFVHFFIQLPSSANSFEINSFKVKQKSQKSHFSSAVLHNLNDLTYLHNRVLVWGFGKFP